MTDANTSTRQLTVNAAFLKEIKEDNLHLKISLGSNQSVS